MANAKEIKRKIKSIKNTAKITGAMELISTVKMKKAQDLALNKKEFVLEIFKMFMHLEKSFGDFPLFKNRKEWKTLAVIISSNKWLCWGYNVNVFKKVNSYIQETGEELEFVTIWKKAAQFVASTWNKLIADFSQDYGDEIKSFFTKSIVELLMEEFLGGKYNKIKIFYSYYVSAIKQIPVDSTFLPISKNWVKDYLFEIAGEQNIDIEKDIEQNNDLLEYKVEPSKWELAEKILPIIVHMMFFDIMLEAKASEHSSRMIAMKNAKESAINISKKLTLQYNKARQALITREVSEITAWVESMKDV